MVEIEGVAFRRFQVGVDHLGDELLEGVLGFPAKPLHGAGRVAEQCIDFGGPEVAGIDSDDGAAFGKMRDADFVDAFAFPFELDADSAEGQFGEFADGVLLASGDDMVHDSMR